MSRPLTYFVSDVHLGLQVADASAREAQFVDFLRGIPADRTEALYLMGDIWDFWYEYKDVVPKGYVRVFAALTELMDAGVKVYFFQGNHDIWTYSYFEELGMKKLVQPYLVRIGTKTFCLGHGDGLGPGMAGYKMMRWAFHNSFFQRCFSALHPRLAFALATGWSTKSRLSRREAYHFKGADEPLYKFCVQQQKRTPVNFYIFGHYHCRADVAVEGARLLLLGDWITRPNHMVFDADSGSLTVA